MPPVMPELQGQVQAVLKRAVDHIISQQIFDPLRFTNEVLIPYLLQQAPQEIPISSGEKVSMKHITDQFKNLLTARRQDLESDEKRQKILKRFPRFGGIRQVADLVSTGVRDGHISRHEAWRLLRELNSTSSLVRWPETQQEVAKAVIASALTAQNVDQFIQRIAATLPDSVPSSKGPIPKSDVIKAVREVIAGREEPKVLPRTGGLRTVVSIVSAAHQTHLSPNQLFRGYIIAQHNESRGR